MNAICLEIFDFILYFFLCNPISFVIWNNNIYNKENSLDE